MNQWAEAYGDKCTFLCVCVVGSPQAVKLAASMGEEMKLANCVNGYVDNRRSLPRRGQLGCSGFIVFDKDGALVAAETSAFLQVRSLAFAHVRTLVDALVAGKPPPKVCPGMQVTITGLTSAGGTGLNGQRATCLAVPEDPTGRITVRVLRSGKQLKLKPLNVAEMATTGCATAESDALEVEEAAAEAAEDDDDDGAACTTGS